MDMRTACTFTCTGGLSFDLSSLATRTPRHSSLHDYYWRVRGGSPKTACSSTQIQQIAAIQTWPDGSGGSDCAAHRESSTNAGGGEPRTVTQG